MCFDNLSDIYEHFVVIVQWVCVWRFEWNISLWLRLRLLRFYRYIVSSPFLCKQNVGRLFWKTILTWIGIRNIIIFRGLKETILTLSNIYLCAWRFDEVVAMAIRWQQFTGVSIVIIIVYDNLNVGIKWFIG